MVGRPLLMRFRCIYKSKLTDLLFYFPSQYDNCCKKCVALVVDLFDLLNISEMQLANLEFGNIMVFHWLQYHKLYTIWVLKYLARLNSNYHTPIFTKHNYTTILVREIRIHIFSPCSLLHVFLYIIYCIVVVAMYCSTTQVAENIL